MERVEGSASAGKKILKGPRACSTCATAKSRCIPGPARQEKCERCHRLRKPCSSQTPAPPRKRKEPKPTRVSELERRLEDLTARMESVQRAGQAAVPSPPESDHYVPHTYPPLAPDDPLHPRNISGTSVPIPTFGPDSPFGHIFPSRSIFDGPSEHEPPTSNRRLLPATTSTSSPTPPGPTPSQPTTTGATNSSPCQLSSSPQSHPQRSPLWPEGDEAESLLGVYRKHMAHLFPFAVVPPHLTSAQMREQRPLFWKAIMMEVQLFDGARQVALGNELLREISEAAFMKPQKNLDLLQGLQMLIACYHYNLNNFQMVNLLFLARSITTSLGSAELKGPPNQAAGYDSESLEQMRAFAGTYYLVTITFTTNKRPDALMNTSYLATCCRALHGQMEYPTDELVVHLVRAQQLSQSISQGFARRKAGYNESQMSQAAFIKGLQDRIQGFAAALPPHIRANPSLTGHLSVAEILVYENRLEELSRCEVACRSGEQGSMASSPESVNETTPEYVRMLWACARVVRTFLTNWFAREAGDYPRFIRLSSFDLTYVFLTMLKMVTLQIPGWDLARVREELHFDEFVTRLAKHMEHASARRKRKSKEGVASGQSSNHESTGPENEAGDLFTKLAGKIRFMKDHLHANGFDSAYAASQVARVCDPAPMTLADAAQNVLQDLGGGLWQDLTASPSEWDLLFVDEAVDWAAVLSDYNMTDSGYVA